MSTDSVANKSSAKMAFLLQASTKKQSPYLRALFFFYSPSANSFPSWMR